MLFEGTRASNKTTVLSTISRLKKYNYRSIWIPMTATVTIDKARFVFEKFFKTSENRFIMNPIDEMKHIFIIDDLHLESQYTHGSNLRTNFSEFFRMWDNYGGYYHIENGYFVNIEKLRIMMAKKNISSKTKLHRESDRFTYYVNSLYFDELDNDRFRMFVQNWLTNKTASNTSKLVNKFYILITNSLMSIKEKITRSEDYSKSQVLPIINFHHFVRLCSNFSHFTLMLSDTLAEHEKEEDVIAQLLAFELSSTFGDRIQSPSIRTDFHNKIQEVCKHNFLIPDITADKIGNLSYGNFHDLHKIPSKFVYSKNKPEEFKEIVAKIKKKFKSEMKGKKAPRNNYLEAFLDIPGSVRFIYKIARLIESSNSHILLIAPPGTGGREYLQLACLVNSTNTNDCILYEPNVRISNDVVEFRSCFRKSMLLCIKSRSDLIFYIDDNHIDDILYFDYIANFLTLFDNDSIEMFDYEF